MPLKAIAIPVDVYAQHKLHKVASASPLQMKKVLMAEPVERTALVLESCTSRCVLPALDGPSWRVNIHIPRRSPYHSMQRESRPVHTRPVRATTALGKVRTAEARSRRRSEHF